MYIRWLKSMNSIEDEMIFLFFNKILKIMLDKQIIL